MTASRTTSTTTTSPSAPAGDDTERFTTLIGIGALQGLLSRGVPVCILDASFDLTDATAGSRAHAQARLPAALHADLERDLSGAKRPRDAEQPGFVGGRHPLPARADFAATAGRFGIDPGLQVVAYDRQGGVYASRAWWLLRWLGHDAVAVLDGGFAAWAAAGLPVESGPVAAPEVARPPYPTADHAAGRRDAAGMRTIDAEGVQRRLGRWPLIDARAAERYRGDAEPLDPRAGHIPGALNRPFSHNLGADGRFKPAHVLRAEFAPLLGDAKPVDVVHQCGSGVTACHNLLAMEHAGLTGSMLYAGSWSDWSSDPARPLAIG